LLSFDKNHPKDAGAITERKTQGSPDASSHSLSQVNAAKDKTQFHHRYAIA
jgi:hypothetical protein